MSATAQRGSGAPSMEEARLARGAAAGDGRAFAALYERYEQRAYNLAYRITGSEPDAADATEQAFLGAIMRGRPASEDDRPAFAPQIFSATRNACHDLMEKRQPNPPGEMNPESSPKEVRDPQKEVREANLRLPARQREALALRELEGLSYGEIAAIMEIAPDSVAKLIDRGRVNLSDELHGTGLAAVGAPSPECERALPLIAAREDGQLEAGSGDDAWLDSHLSDCERCALAVEEMREAAGSYRAWAPIAALPWMLEETMAKAASLAGADWSEEIAEAIASRSGPDPRPRTAAAHRDGGGDQRRPSRRRGAIAAAGVAALLLGSGIATALVGEPSPVSPRLVADSKAADDSPESKPEQRRQKERRGPGASSQTEAGAPAAALPLTPIEEGGYTPTGGGAASAPEAAPDPSGVSGIEPPKAAAAPTAKPTPTPQPASAPAPPPVEAPPPPEAPVEEPAPDHPSKGKGPPPGVPKGGP